MKVYVVYAYYELHGRVALIEANVNKNSGDHHNI